MPLPSPSQAGLATTPQVTTCKGSPGLVRPLCCLPSLRGPDLQVGFFLAAGQFHFLVDTQTAPNNNKDLLPLKPPLPKFILDILLCTPVGKENSTAPFPF